MKWDDVIVDAAATDTGMRRANNQDSHAMVRASTAERWEKRGHVYMVADGMGAHAVGELASKLAVDNIPHNYAKAKDGSPAEAVTKAYKEVGALIHGRATANRDFQGMGTTCSTLVMLPAGALIAHVGDSRVYRVRGSRIDQLSFDHSLVWELVRQKHLSPEQAEKTVPRNVITRSLGPDPTVEVDIEGPLPVEPGDVFLLCSDGLSGPVKDDELGVFAGNFHPEDACRYLIHLANLRGGHDNITVVILRAGAWVEPGSGETDEFTTHAGIPRKKGGFRLSNMLQGLKRRPVAEPVEEHLYVSTECPADEPIVERLDALVRQSKAQAIEAAWPADWAALANHVRDAEERRGVGDFRGALKHLGESIALLGTAARLRRRDHANGSH